jgi:hypothetical protein
MTSGKEPRAKAVGWNAQSIGGIFIAIKLNAVAKKNCD